MVPGEFRTSQNWIGGSRPGNARFVPPPSDPLMNHLDAFEKHLNSEEKKYPSIIDVGLIHVQFETIHPFLDGNGRISRLLITFILIIRGDLKEPFLYMSLFLKENREEYYNQLNLVRQNGEWEEWLDFFLHGLAETAKQVSNTSQKISELFRVNEEKIKSLKRASKSARDIHKLLLQRAVTSPIKAAKETGYSTPTTRLALNNMANLGIITSVNGKGKEKLYAYSDLISLLDQGTDPARY